MNESKSDKTDISLKTLKGMQSVRATFTLPKQSISLLSTVANQLGVKQKSIFDHLVEDKKILGRIINDAREFKPEKSQRKQKTFVLSRSSLSALDAFSRKYKLPRDILVEYSIRQLHPVIDQEKHKHDNRKKMFREMEQFKGQIHSFVEQARRIVGEEEETFQQLESIFSLYDRCMEDLAQTIEKGKCMEEFHQKIEP